MIPKLDSPETLRCLAGIVGGMKSLHLLLKESGYDITYTTLSKYISNGAQFEERIFINLFEIIKGKGSFTAREAMRNIEDTYIVLSEMARQGVFVPKRMGEAGELDDEWEKEQALTKEEIEDMEAEFGMKLSSEQKEVLQGKRKSLPKSSRSVDDLFDDDDEVEFVRDSKAEVLIHPTVEEAKEFLEEDEPEEPEPVEEKKLEKKTNFLDDFLNEAANEPPPPQSSLTEDPFEAGLRRTPDVFSTENHRF